MAHGLKSASAGWSVATSAIVRKEISAWRIRRSVRGAPEAVTLAENIVKFIFKVGDKIRPLTEENGGVGGEKGASQLLPGGWNHRAWFWRAGLRSSRSLSVCQPLKGDIRGRVLRKTLLVFQTQIILVIFRGLNGSTTNLTKTNIDLNGCLKRFHASVQVCHQHAGADGGGGLHDRVPERRHPPQENARPRLAEEMLPDDRQKAPEESEILHYPAPIVVYQDRPRHHQAFHQVAPVLGEAEGLQG